MDDSNDFVTDDATLEDTQSTGTKETSTIGSFEHKGRSYKDLDEWKTHQDELEKGLIEKGQEAANAKRELEELKAQMSVQEFPLPPQPDPNEALLIEELIKKGKILTEDKLTAIQKDAELSQFVETVEKDATAQGNNDLRLSQDEQADLKKYRDAGIPLDKAFRIIKEDVLTKQIAKEKKSFVKTTTSSEDTGFETGNFGEGELSLDDYRDPKLQYNNLEKILRTRGIV